MVCPRANTKKVVHSESDYVSPQTVAGAGVGPVDTASCEACGSGTPAEVRYNKGPVDKIKNSAETRSGPGRIVNLKIE